MATPTPAPAKSTPRKLPIKRRTPSNSSDPFTSPDPLLSVKPEPDLTHSAAAPADDGFDDDEDYDEDFGEEEAPAVDLDGGAQPGAPVSNIGAGDGGARPTPPFKYHRIWSESDEIRFLQGLLGCWSQGMVFPRDLNLFYDRFSESMPSPYSRSQLSEKLRRLRKKFRVMSGRISRGQDPSRLAPHDRDLLHLCTRLWHPSYAASSPFSLPDPVAVALTSSPAGSGGSSASAGNKRRRPNPRTPSGRPPAVAENPLPAEFTPSPPLLLTTTPSLPTHSPSLISSSSLLPPPAEEKKPSHMVANQNYPQPAIVKIEEPQVGSRNDEASREEPNRLVLKAVLDVFDTCLREVQAALASQGLLQSDGATTMPGARSDLEKRWREQRSTEMNVLVRRLRLVFENAAPN